MLDKIRKGSNSLVVRIILGLIAFSFVGVGGASFINGNSQGNVVVFSDADSISMEEFQFAKANEIESIQRQNGINLTDEQIAELNIDNNILRRLIHLSMIRYLAKIYDFDASEGKVISYVQKSPYFKNSDGDFDLSIFKSIFNNSPKREEEYISSVKDQIIYATMSDVFGEAFKPSSPLIDNMTNYMAETRVMDIVSIELGFKPSNYRSKEVSDDQVLKFYEENKEMFVIPELRSFNYIVADTNYLLKKLKISEQELKTYFNENMDEFSSKNYSKVKKEVKEVVAQRKIEELSSELAKNLEEDVASGLTLSEISKKYNIALFSQKEISLDGMNSSSKSEYAEIADSIFELMDKEVSYPIEIQDKNNIVVAELRSIKQSRQRELKEVDKEIRLILEKKLLAIENIGIIETFRKSYNPSKFNKTNSKKKGINVLLNQKYMRAELPMQDKLPPDLLKSMFETNKNESTPVVSDGKNLYFAYVKTINSSQAKAKKIRDNSKEHFVNVLKEGVWQDLLSELSRRNKMQVLQN